MLDVGVFPIAAGKQEIVALGRKRDDIVIDGYVYLGARYFPPQIGYVYVQRDTS